MNNTGFFNKYLYDIGYCGLGFSSFPKIFNFKKKRLSKKIKNRIEKYFEYMGGDLFFGYVLKLEYWADYPEFWETTYYNRNGNWQDKEVLKILDKLKKEVK